MRVSSNPALRAMAVSLVCCLTLAASDTVTAVNERVDSPDRRTLDRVLAAYLAGDFGVIERAFTASRDFDARRLSRPRYLDEWLGTWHRGKAAFLIELAEASTRIAPQYARPLLDSGHRYLTVTGTEAAHGAVDCAFMRQWHRVAIGLLQRFSSPGAIEEYVEAVRRATPSGDHRPDEARLTLALAVAQEQRCWAMRPSLQVQGEELQNLMQAAGLKIRDDNRRPELAIREGHGQCLRDALARFEAAADRTLSEARVRGAWTLLQLHRPADALAWLQEVRAGGDDPKLGYWAALLRGRALDSLGRFDAAAGAYREALTWSPRAQSAAVGLSLALFRADRAPEADAVARSIRAASSADDPWWIYGQGDQRFVHAWIEEMRGALR